MTPLQVVALSDAEAEIATANAETADAQAQAVAAQAAADAANELLEAANADIARLTQTLNAPGLLFWSRFGEGVELGAPYDFYSSGAYQDLVGADHNTGFKWPPAKAGSGRFQVRPGPQSNGAVYNTDTLAEYMALDLPVVEPRGRVLHTLIKKNPLTGLGSQNGTSQAAQCPYLINPATQGDMYISFWRKFDPELAVKLVNGWHMVFEWKTTGDYRISAQLVNFGPAGTPIWWQCKADNNANGGLPLQEFWRVDNRTVPVPLVGWFKFEAFWHRSAGSDGRIWLAVNGQKLVDKFGPNIGVNNNPIDRIMPLQLYSAACYPLEQWDDDVQIWSAFPPVTPGAPWYDGVYAPH